jgi:hypothetical protein
MKQWVTLSFFILFISASFAQTSSLPPTDKSPMDMSYYPSNFPVLKIQDKVPGPVMARVIYSRPQKNGRVIFGDLVEYGKVWRVGANEATEIEFYKPVKIGGKKIEKGRYTLYALVNTDSWTMIINRDIDTWGAFKYDAQKDLVRVTIPVQKLSEPVEALAMSFEKAAQGFNLIVAWDTVEVALPISVK